MKPLLFYSLLILGAYAYFAEPAPVAPPVAELLTNDEPAVRLLDPRPLPLPVYVEYQKISTSWNRSLAN